MLVFALQRVFANVSEQHNQYRDTLSSTGAGLHAVQVFLFWFFFMGTTRNKCSIHPVCLHWLPFPLLSHAWLSPAWSIYHKAKTFGGGGGAGSEVKEREKQIWPCFFDFPTPKHFLHLGLVSKTSAVNSLAPLLSVLHTDLRSAPCDDIIMTLFSLSNNV